MLIHQRNKAQSISTKVRVLLQVLEFNGILDHFHILPITGTTALTDMMMVADWILHLSPGFHLTLQISSKDILIAIFCCTHPPVCHPDSLIPYIMFSPVQSHFQLNPQWCLPSSCSATKWNKWWHLTLHFSLLVFLTTKANMQWKNEWMNK